LKKIVVCISGYGSNLQAIIDACESGNISGKVVLVAGNKKNAFGFTRAAKAGIRTTFSKDIYELFSEIEKEKPDIVALAGFMKIIPSDIVKRFTGRMINVHPSYLPDFPGLNSIKRAFEAGAAETGVTVHYVDGGVDTGKIISQVRVKIESGDNLEELEERIHRTEHELYVKVIQKLIQKT